MDIRTLTPRRNALARRRDLVPRLVVVGAAAIALLGAVIAVQPPEAAQDLIAAPIHVAPGNGEQIASLQFDMTFDTTSVEVVAVEPGISASQAAKDVVFSNITNSNIRVIVAGMNQNTIEEGVVATVYMRPLKTLDADSGAQVMELGSIVLADPVGQPIEAADGTLALDESMADSDQTSSTSRAESDVSETYDSTEKALVGGSTDAVSDTGIALGDSEVRRQPDVGARPSVLTDILNALVPNSAPASQSVAPQGGSVKLVREYPVPVERQTREQEARSPTQNPLAPVPATAKTAFGSKLGIVPGADAPEQSGPGIGPGSMTLGPLAKAHTAIRQTAEGKPESPVRKDVRTPQAFSLDGRLLWVLVVAALITILVLLRKMLFRT